MSPSLLKANSESIILRSSFQFETSNLNFKFKFLYLNFQKFDYGILVKFANRSTLFVSYFERVNVIDVSILL